MGILIDTSILIHAERRRINLLEKTQGREQESVYLSVITASELLHGVHRAQNPSVRARRSAFVESVLTQFPLLDIDIATARMHAQIWSTLATQGQLIGPHDLWLAATCLSHGLAIATANVREFERVPGLALELWA